MSNPCTRCESSGFLNLCQIPEPELFLIADFPEKIIEWIKINEDHDVSVCDCCGDGENWHGIMGEHYNVEDPMGNYGPYSYNGGLCECH